MITYDKLMINVVCKQTFLRQLTLSQFCSWQKLSNHLSILGIIPQLFQMRFEILTTAHNINFTIAYRW